MKHPLRKKIRAQIEENATLNKKSVTRRRKREILGAWGALIFIFLVLTICISPNFFQHLPEAIVGKAWPHQNVTAPFQMTIPDVEAMESQKRRLESNHSKVFRHSEEVEAKAAAQSRSILAFLEQSSVTSSTEDLGGDIISRFGVDLQESTIQTLRSQTETSRTLSDLDTIFHHLLEVRGVSADRSLLDTYLRKSRAVILSAGSTSHVTSTTMRQVLGYPGEAFEYAENAYLTTFQRPENVKAAYADLVKQLLRPNIVHDQEETQNRLNQAMNAVSISRLIQPGSVIVKQGDTVTAIQAEAIHEIEASERRNDILRALGGAVMVLMTMAFTMLYANRYNQELHFNSRSILMVALPAVFAVSLGRVILNLGGGYLLGAFAMPAGMVGILTVMLFDARFAMVITTMACVFFSVATGLTYPYMMIGMVGGFTAIASLRNLQERREVLFTGIHIALANCLVAIAVSLIMNPARPEMQAGFIAALVNGLVCYMLAVAALPIFENIFQVTTDVLLLELTSGNHPLLQKMEEKAPGSLYHSMNVASLAEDAAEAVGARYLLVRAGAYFHDIGKMLKPAYFTENQTTPEQKTIHSRLSPAMSTLIIKNHVKEGVELARSYRLPEKVIDFIPEHHGTTLIKYFYVQALKKAELDGSDEIISEEEFRYPGPKPRSIETAILMLADSVEAIATSRFSGKSPDETEIRRAVHEAVTEKFEDRQLENSPLTFQDLEIIKEAFVKGLQNRFHQRVKYPTMPNRRMPAMAQPATATSDKHTATEPTKTSNVVEVVPQASRGQR